MKKNLRRAAEAMLAAAVILLLPLICCAAAPKTEAPLTVRIGVFESNGFIALSDGGEMTGYGARFMERLAKYANVRYEYVRLSWGECMEGLLSGRIDIVTDARRSAEREKLYDFSVQNIGQIQAAVFVPQEMKDIYFDDYGVMKKLRVGFEYDSQNRLLYEQ